MPNAGLFMAMAGLGVSFAGFAGLLATFEPEEERDSAVWWWRITAVVRTGLGLTFLGFGIIATEVATDDVTLTVRIASAYIVAFGLVEILRHSGPGPAWPDESMRRTTIALSSVGMAVVALNVFLGSLGFLMVLMLFVLSPLPRYSFGR